MYVSLNVLKINRNSSSYVICYLLFHGLFRLMVEGAEVLAYER